MSNILSRKKIIRQLKQTHTHVGIMVLPLSIDDHDCGWNHFKVIDNNNLYPHT